MPRYDTMSADQCCQLLVDSLRKQRWADAEAALTRLDFVCHYGSSRPSWRGIQNLTHSLRHAITTAMQHAPDGFGLLTAIEESHTYDPSVHPLPNDLEPEPQR
jgi:hypothetical protein